MKNINLNIKEQRLKNGWTQEELAKKLNVSISLIRMYENGSRNPSDKVKEALCDVFNISMNELYAESDTEMLQQKLNEQISTKNLNDEELQLIKEVLIDIACNIDNIYYYISFDIPPLKYLKDEYRVPNDYNKIIDNVISNEFKIIATFFYKQISKPLTDTLKQYPKYSIEQKQQRYMDRERLKNEMEENFKDELDKILGEIKQCINEIKKVEIPNYMIPLIYESELRNIYSELKYEDILEFSNDFIEMPLSIEPHIYYAVNIGDNIYIIKLDNKIIDKQIYLIRTNEIFNNQYINLCKIFDNNNNLIIQLIDSNIPKVINNKEIIILGRVVATIPNINI